MAIMFHLLPIVIFGFQILFCNSYKQTLENTEGANQQWTFQRNWQHWVHKTKTNKTKTQHNICWTPLYANKYK